MTSPEELIKRLLSGIDTSPLKKEVTASIRLDRLICTILAEGYFPPPSIIVLRSTDHTERKVADAVAHTMLHSDLVYHALASVLLLENTITLATLEKALRLRATNICGSYPPPAQALVQSVLEDLKVHLEACRRTFPKVTFN